MVIFCGYGYTVSILVIRCVSNISTDLYLQTYMGTSMDLILSRSYGFVNHILVF
jgi:hypothetical protein